MSLPLVVGLGSVDPALVTGGLDPGVHCVAEPDARQPATTAGPSPAFEAVIDRDLLDRMPALRVIARNGVGVEKDRKSTRLNSSHVAISYAVFCLKKKKTENKTRYNIDMTDT